MKKHAHYTIGSDDLNIDKMSSSEINAAIKKYGALANERQKALRAQNLEILSNTYSRFHETRLKKTKVGTKKLTFRVNTQGSLAERRDRLHYILAYYLDPQTDVDVVKEYAKSEIQYLFGSKIPVIKPPGSETEQEYFNVEYGTESQLTPYYDILRDIFKVYRSLGIELGWRDSAQILKNVSTIIRESSTMEEGATGRFTPEELETAFSNMYTQFAEEGKTVDDFRDTIAAYGKQTIIDGRIETNTELLKLLRDNLI